MLSSLYITVIQGRLGVCQLTSNRESDLVLKGPDKNLFMIFYDL